MGKDDGGDQVWHGDVPKDNWNPKEHDSGYGSSKVQN